MAITIGYKFGSFDLDSTNGITLESVAPTIVKRARYKTSISGKGANIQSDRRDGIRVAVKGSVLGSDDEDARTKSDALFAALTNGEQALRLWTDREILCRVERDFKTKFVKGSTMSVVEFSATFRSTRPWWRSTTVLSDSWTVSGSPQQKLLTADTGNAPTYPTISITNNGTTFTDKYIWLTNLSTEQQLGLQGVSIGSGETLTIDFDAGRLGTGSTQDQRPSQVDGEFFSLSAGVANTLELVTDVTSPSFGVAISWYPSHWRP